LLHAVVPVAAAAWETADADTFTVDEATDVADDCPKNPPCGEACDSESKLADAARSLKERSILMIMR
jgi:hypothetical protein